MLLRTEQLTKNYGSFCALDALNLEIKPGEVFGLLGPNGSGKTTTLRLILGFLQPSRGHAWIDGHDCWREGVASRKKVSYLPGELRLYDNMTGRQLIQFLLDLRGEKPPGNVQDLARIFDIDLDRPIATLSSGMKRKVALLQVLLPRTPLVIMDEPTNALDPTMRDALLGQVKEAQSRGQAIVFSSHILSEVEAVCDRVGILQKGKLVHLQEMSQLRQGREVRATIGSTIADFTTLPGLNLRERRGQQVILEYTGKQSDLLGWLAKQDLADVRLEPLGLASIYYRFHGSMA